MKLKLTALLLLATLFSFGQIVKNQEWEFTNNVTIDGTLKLTDAPTNGYVLTTDGSGNASWQASGSGVVMSATVTLSSAEILALHTTPKTIIAAQGAGTIIQPLSYFISSSSGTAYSTDVIASFILNGSTWQNASVFGANSTVQARLSTSSISTSPSSTWSNGAFAVTTPTSNPTGGTMTVKITVLYTVITL